VLKLQKKINKRETDTESKIEYIIYEEDMRLPVKEVTLHISYDINGSIGTNIKTRKRKEY